MEQPDYPNKRMSDGHRGRAEAWRLSSGQDIEDALCAAEHLLRQSEERHRHEQNRTFGVVSIALGLLSVSLVAYLFYFDGLAELTTLVVTGSLVVVIFGWSAIVHNRSVALDNTLELATEIALMIGRAVYDVSDRENWSYLRLETTKLRLSAFPLKGSSSSKARRWRVPRRWRVLWRRPKEKATGT